MNIQETITAELREFQKEFERFETLVTYLEQAKQTSVKAKESLEVASNEYKSKIQTLKDSHAEIQQLTQTIEWLNQEILSVDFPSRLTNIDESLIKVIKEFKDANKELVAKNNSVIEQWEKIDFNGGMAKLQDELENGVKRHEQALINLKNYIKDLDLPDKISDLKFHISGEQKEIISKVDSLTKWQSSFEQKILDQQQQILVKHNQRFDSVEAKQNVLQTTIIVGVVINSLMGLGVLIYLFMK